MPQANLEQAIAALSESDLESVLNRLVAADAAKRGYDQKKLVADSAALTRAVQIVADDVNISLPHVREITGEHRAEALRALLQAMAQTPELEGSVAAVLGEQRPTLFEPVTSALGPSGIILVLSLDVDVQYKMKDGKRDLAVSVKKRPTAAKLLQKIAKFF